MISFKEICALNSFEKKIQDETVSLSFGNKSLFIRFDSKDQVIACSYTGGFDLWLNSLCFLMMEKNISALKQLSKEDWLKTFRDDLFFQEISEPLTLSSPFYPLEMLKALLHTYLGRDDLYKEESPLICRCFGVREKDLLDLHNKDIKFSDLHLHSSAGLGCRSCSSQVKKWWGESEEREERVINGKTKADWLVEMDYFLSCYPKALDWKMQIRSFKKSQVLISFDGNYPQREIESENEKLQDFLAAGLGLDLSFILIRREHLEKARE